MRVVWMLLSLGLAVVPALAMGKRAAPQDVPPIVHQGVAYSFPHFGYLEEEGQNGGVVEARDVKSGRRLWRLKAYTTRRVPGREQDVQDVFITSAKLAGNRLVVTNEEGQTFEVDLTTRAVRAR
jgi:hypothetical protein